MLLEHHRREHGERDENEPAGLKQGPITGTVPQAQLPAAVVTNTATGVALSGVFDGNGSGLTNLNYSAMTQVMSTRLGILRNVISGR